MNEKNDEPLAPTAPNNELAPDYSSFQVARKELFNHHTSPALVMCLGKITFTSSCIQLMPDVTHVHFLVDAETKRLLVKPCQPNDRDALCWCSGMYHAPKSIAGDLFFYMIIQLTGWNPYLKYRLLAQFIQNGNDQLLLFDLSQPIVTERPKSREDLNLKCFYPLDWQDRFGIPASDYDTVMHVCSFSGHTVFGLPEDPLLKEQTNLENDLEITTDDARKENNAQ